MPTIAKDILNKNKSILIDKSAFEKAKNADNKEFVIYLTALMKLANERYNTVYNACQNKPDIEKFYFCKENFQEIKSIIESKKNLKQTSKLYFEAWISVLYSDVHALNLEPETQEQLDNLNKKIQEIDIEFKKLVAKKSNLDSLDAILKYINKFGQAWKIKEKRLLADAYYNYAEALVEKSDLENALHYFIESSSFYKNAAAIADNLDEKTKFLIFANQTDERLKEIKKNLLKETKKVSSIRIKKLSDFIIPQYIIINETGISQEIIESVKKTSIIKKDIPPIRKREAVNQEPTYPEKNKKLKIKPSVSTQREIKLQWETECKELLEKFKQMKVNDKIEGILTPFHKKTFNERRAIVYNNYAISIIKDLIVSKKYVHHFKKLDLLSVAKKQFIESAKFYTKAGLIKQKGKIMECINGVALSIKKLKNLSNTTTTSADILTHKKSLSLIKKELRTRENPYYLTRTFFKSLCSKNVINTYNSHKLTS